MMLCGALRRDGSGYRDSRTKTEFASVITPRSSVVEKNISSAPTSWLAPVGSGRTSSALASSLTWTLLLLRDLAQQRFRHASWVVATTDTYTVIEVQVF